MPCSEPHSGASPPRHVDTAQYRKSAIDGEPRPERHVPGLGTAVKDRSGGSTTTPATTAQPSAGRPARRSTKDNGVKRRTAPPSPTQLPTPQTSDDPPPGAERQSPAPP